MEKFTKKYWKRNTDGVVVAEGTLIAPHTLQVEKWENGGVVLKNYDLSGKVEETETNHVLVVGKETSDAAIEVLKMLVVPEDGPIKSFNFGSLEEPIGIYSSCNLKSVDEKTAAGSGKKYYSLKFASGENGTVIINTFYFHRQEKDSRYIFVTNGKFESSESTFVPESGENKGKEITWKTHRSFALSQIV